MHVSPGHGGDESQLMVMMTIDRSSLSRQGGMGGRGRRGGAMIDMLKDFFFYLRSDLCNVREKGTASGI